MGYHNDNFSNDLSDVIDTLQGIQRRASTAQDNWEEITSEFGNDDKDEIIQMLAFAKEVAEHASDEAEEVKTAWDTHEKFRELDTSASIEEILDTFDECGRVLTRHTVDLDEADSILGAWTSIVDVAGTSEPETILSYVSEGRNGWRPVCTALGVSFEAQWAQVIDMIRSLKASANPSADDQKALLLGRAVLAALRAGAGIPVVETVPQTETPAPH
jgi:hypothetical protein